MKDEVRITGLAPRPGARDVVHHLIVAAVGEEDVPAIERRDAADDGAGFDCGGGLGEFPTAVPLSGSLLGGDYPRGIGNVVAPGSRILLQIHYSTTSDAPSADQTALDFRLDTTAVDAGSIAIANLGWMVGEGMRVLAVKPDGATECLLEIPQWDFGWEQPYWFAEPISFDPEDQLYIECRFDNSAANQPDGGAPRDIAWGENDQDMCAAFLSFTPVAE